MRKTVKRSKNIKGQTYLPISGDYKKTGRNHHMPFWFKNRGIVPAVTTGKDQGDKKKTIDAISSLPTQHRGAHCSKQITEISILTNPR